MPLFNLPISALDNCEYRKYSQSSQDGILLEIFNSIGMTDRFCVEFGGRDGYDLSNTAYLEEAWGFKRLLLDGNGTGPVHKEFLTKDNIVSIFQKYRVPEDEQEFDYLSIDVDGNDFHLWRALWNGYHPRVVTIEFNSKWRYDECKVIAYNESHVWQGDDYYGASMAAMKKLGDFKGYTLVYRLECLDLFFVRNDLLSPSYRPPTAIELLPQPIICHRPSSLADPSTSSGQVQDWIDF
jgi:hypothetical protein